MPWTLVTVVMVSQDGVGLSQQGCNKQERPFPFKRASPCLVLSAKASCTVSSHVVSSQAMVCRTMLDVRSRVGSDQVESVMLHGMRSVEMRSGHVKPAAHLVG